MNQKSCSDKKEASPTDLIYYEFTVFAIFLNNGDPLINFLLCLSYTFSCLLIKVLYVKNPIPASPTKLYPRKTPNFQKGTKAYGIFSFSSTIFSI